MDECKRRTFTFPLARAKPTPRVAWGMTLWVACNACRQTFDAHLHGGLLRCAPCAERTAYRLAPAAARVVVL